LVCINVNEVRVEGVEGTWELTFYDGDVNSFVSLLIEKEVKRAIWDYDSFKCFMVYILVKFLKEFWDDLKNDLCVSWMNFMLMGEWLKGLSAWCCSSS